MISRKWGLKRGRFPLLGGRWMFRREMGSKRGSLPPKEGDLTCNLLSRGAPPYLNEARISNFQFPRGLHSALYIFNIFPTFNEARMSSFPMASIVPFTFSIPSSPIILPGNKLVNNHTCIIILNKRNENRCGKILVHQRQT